MTSPARIPEQRPTIQDAVRRIIESMAVIGVRVAWRVSLYRSETQRPRRNG